MPDKEIIRSAVRKNYGAIALRGSGGGCCSGSCGCAGNAKTIGDSSRKIGYAESDLSGVPSDSNMGLGCGNPLAIAALKEGETVLDLGSGGGFDCFLARRQVGETGRVIGVDMTPEMIRLARKNAAESGYANVEFRLGEIEHLPLADGSADVIISNCVINLSPEKARVFREAYRVLKPGGRLSVSDVVAFRELPETIKQDLALTAGCIAGAETADKIQKMLLDAGFSGIKIVPKENSKDIIDSWLPGRNLGDLVASMIIEAKKQPD